MPIVLASGRVMPPCHNVVITIKEVCQPYQSDYGRTTAIARMDDGGGGPHQIVCGFKVTLPELDRFHLLVSWVV
jgi:hypothetical protein